MPEAEEKRMKTRAARILSDHGIHTGTVLLGDEIVVHDFNGSGRTARFDWHGNHLGIRKSHANWHGKSPNRRRFRLLR